MSLASSSGDLLGSVPVRVQLERYLELAPLLRVASGLESAA